MKKLVKFEVYLPLQNNELEDLNYVHEFFEDRASSIVGGATISKNKGVWFSDSGIKYVDYNKSYIFVLDVESMSEGDLMRFYTTIHATVFDVAEQQSIYMEISGQPYIMSKSELDYKTFIYLLDGANVC